MTFVLDKDIASTIRIYATSIRQRIAQLIVKRRYVFPHNLAYLIPIIMEFDKQKDCTYFFLCEINLHHHSPQL